MDELRRGKCLRQELQVMHVHWRLLTPYFLALGFGEVFHDVINDACGGPCVRVGQRNDLIEPGLSDERFPDVSPELHEVLVVLEVSISVLMRDEVGKRPALIRKSKDQ